MAENKKKPDDHAYHNGSVRRPKAGYDGGTTRELKSSGREGRKSVLTTRTARRLIVVAVFALLILLGWESYQFAYRIANGKAVDSPPGKSVQVFVRDNMSQGDVATMLQEKGLLDNTIEFVVHAKMKGYNPSRYTGSHILNTCMNVEQQLNELMNLNGD